MMDTEMEVKNLTKDILEYKGFIGEFYIEIGKCLLRAKEILPHGEWGKWLKEEVQFSQRKADEMMRIARNFSSVPKSLSYSKVRLLVKIPEAEREQFMEQHPVSEMSCSEMGECVSEYLSGSLTKSQREEDSNEDRGILSEEVQSFLAGYKKINAKMVQIQSKISALQKKENDLRNDLEKLLAGQTTECNVMYECSCDYGWRFYVENDHGQDVVYEATDLIDDYPDKNVLLSVPERYQMDFLFSWRAAKQEKVAQDDSSESGKIVMVDFGNPDHEDMEKSSDAVA